MFNWRSGLSGDSLERDRPLPLERLLNPRVFSPYYVPRACPGIMELEIIPASFTFLRTLCLLNIDITKGFASSSRSILAHLTTLIITLPHIEFSHFVSLAMEAPRLTRLCFIPCYGRYAYPEGWVANLPERTRPRHPVPFKMESLEIDIRQEECLHLEWLLGNSKESLKHLEIQSFAERSYQVLLAQATRALGDVWRIGHYASCSLLGRGGYLRRRR